MTKGSFYHHFRSVEDFHDRLLDDWYTEHVARRKAVVDAETDPRRRLDALRRFGADRRHDTEAAIRAWARSSPRAAEVQRRIDNNRRAYLADTCLALGHRRAEHAESFADLGVLVLAGSQNLVRPGRSGARRAGRRRPARPDPRGDPRDGRPRALTRAAVGPSGRRRRRPR